MNKIAGILLILLLSSASLFAEKNLQEVADRKDWSDHTIEISFGNSLLFLDQGYKSDAGVSKRTLPVASYLFIFEWRMIKHLELSLAWNLPSETVKRVDSAGNVYEKYVAPAYGAGIVYIPVIFRVFGMAYLEPQISAQLFRTYKSTSSKGDFFFPMGMVRLHLSTESGFGVYVGVTQAPEKETTAFIFGIGQRF